MLRRTPLFDQHREAGGRFVGFGGWEMPVQYAGLKPEHLQVRRSVGLFDVSHMGEARVRGAKAVEALSWLLCNDVRGVAVGQAQYNVLCNPAGGAVDDVVIYRLAADDFIVCVNAANRAKDLDWLVKNNPLPGEVRIDDECDDWAQLAVQGPRAASVVDPLTDADLGALGSFRLTETTVAGVGGCIVARTGYTGEDGVEIFCPPAAAPAIWTAVLEAGRPHDICPIGLGARDTLRLEARLCLYGHELTDETSPLQARLGRFVDLDKDGGFLGRDAIVARRKTDAFWLAGLVVEGKRIPREGMAVLADGKEVGRVTSGTRSPTLERGVALAYLRRPHGRPDNRLVIDVRGREAPAVVVKGPFYRRPRTEPT